MKKFLTLTVLVLLFFIIYISYVYANDLHSLSNLELSKKALQTIGVKSDELNVQGWGQLNSRYLSDKGLIKEAEIIFESLNIPLNYEINSKEVGFISLSTNQLVDKFTTIYLSLQTISDVYMPASTYIGICITTTNEEQADIWFNKLSKELKKCKIDIEINVTIIGTLKGYIDKGTQEDLILQAFRSTKSNIVEGIFEDNLVSVSGFTKSAKESLTVGDNKININMALRYHELDDKTYIYVGSPIIQMDY